MSAALPMPEDGVGGAWSERTASDGRNAETDHDAEAALGRILTAAVDLLDASYGAIFDDPAASRGWRTVHQHFGVADLDRLRSGIRAAGVPERLAADGLPVLIRDLPWAGTVATGAPVLVLAVPIRWNQRISGGFVVAAAGRPDFTDRDAELLQALAAAAAIALGSELLTSELLRREAWSDASAEMVSALLTGELDAPLAVLTSIVQKLAAADYACVLRNDEVSDGLLVVARSGDDGPRAGQRVDASGSIAGAAMESHQPRAVPAGVVPHLGGSGATGGGPMMVVPMLSEGLAVGVIAVSRRFGRPAFSRSDLDLLAGFVDHTTVALQLAEVRADRERILLIEDRARIARDLHDIVIQQLFAAGLELRATAAEVPLPRVHAGIDHGVTLIDGAIDRIRTAVLAISPDPLGASLRHRILDVVRDLSREFVQAPELRFHGPVELVARGGLGEDVVAVVREALTNVARHADATRAGVRISVPDGRIRVEVWDDGHGFPETAGPRRGLANLEERASRRGGDFTIGRTAGTTRAVWTASYSEGSDE